MDSYYECLRCQYKTHYKNDMKRHLDRKTKCKRSIESLKNNNYNDEEIYNKSLKIINNKKNNKMIYCKICSKKFSRTDSLERHEKIYCKKDIINITNNENIINNKNIVINQQNFIIINNKDINIKPFDEDWNVEHINTYFVKHLLLSNEKFTDLLSEILKNDKNLNVIVDKSSETGLVYKNNVDMYVEMQKKEIIDQSMYKLNNQIEKYYNDFFTNIKEHLKNAMNIEKKITTSKFNKYFNDKTINKNVINILSNIFENRKNEAVITANTILNTELTGY